jgi:hypothetical protein
MSTRINRRHFLHATAAGSALLGLGDLSFLSRLPRVSAEEAKLDAKLVRLDPDIEPTVRLLEDTPRERLLEEVAARIKSGLSYREVLAALLLAGVRNVQPRPSVGFKFHAVLVVNSAHLASISSPDQHRWLPIFWSLDHFKGSQAATAKESGWRMRGVDESKVPAPDKARAAFVEAMDNWDEEAADAAVAGLARSAGAADVFELMWHYGSRDWRSIGHKAIYVSNSWRTLQAIGWQHAEPVLRSLTYALLAREGADGNPAKSDYAPDRPGRKNAELAKKIRPGWQSGEPKADATAELLKALREGSEQDAPENLAGLLNRGASPQSLWDALLAAAGEMPMRKPGIVTLHAVTTTNALRFAYETSGSEETRKMLLLQNAAFIPLFRKAMGDAEQRRIDQIEPAPLAASGAGALDEIFANVGRDRAAAAGKTLTYLKDHPRPKELIDAARLMVFMKGNDAHDYKFSSALLEDYAHLSPQWRDRYLAAGMYLLRGSGGPDNKLVERTRAALS